MTRYLIEITKAIAYMSLDKYIQEVSMEDNATRVYINRGAAGGISISVKNIKILKTSALSIN